MSPSNCSVLMPGVCCTHGAGTAKGNLGWALGFGHKAEASEFCPRTRVSHRGLQSFPENQGEERLGAETRHA